MKLPDFSALEVSRRCAYINRLFTYLLTYSGSGSGIMPLHLPPCSAVSINTSLQGVSKKVVPPKFFWNIFTLVKSFCMKFFCKFVGNSYPHVSTNFCRYNINISSFGVDFSTSTHRFTLSSHPENENAAFRK